MSRVLWLTPKKTYSQNMHSFLERKLRSLQINNVTFACLHNRANNWLRIEGKRKRVLDPRASMLAEEYLCELINRLDPTVIVVNDLASLWLISGKKHTLSASRGSVYEYKDIPVIILDEMRNVFAKPEGAWIFTNDMQKVRRWYTNDVRPEPKFTYEVIADREGLDRFEAEAHSSIAMSNDIETKGGFITCIGYTLFRNNTIKSYIIPFFHPFKDGGCYWDDAEDEVYAWKVVRRVNANDVYKILQNGTYDSAYYAACHSPLSAYLFDTSDMMHSVWLEAPKKLDFISSIMLDNYRYWKEESKGSKEDGWGRNLESLHRYWRYCALDCHYTLLNCRMLLKYLVKLDWARKNYDMLFRLSVGPCFAAGMTGIRGDRNRHKQIIDKLRETGEEELRKLRVMVDDEEYNPSSSPQTASVLYDIFGAKPTKLQKRRGSKYGERSTDEKVLKLIAEQPNPLLGIFIDQLLAAKKPFNNISKYGSPQKMFRNGRFYYSLSASGTETTRFSGSDHQFWIGTNPQNIPGPMREFLVADPDYVIVDVDYSASDDVFIAYESGDPDKIELVESDRDPHCHHAAFFFKRDYDDVLQGKKDNDPAIVDPIKGIRSNTKRVVHGKNFGMQAWTLYFTMGRKAVVETALALGYRNAHGMSEEELVAVCNELADAYDNEKTGLYRRLKPWLRELIQECIDNGNLLTSACGATRLFFGNPAKDNKVQRDIAAFKGQAGTASNINRALLKLYYGGIIDFRTVIFVLQVHDSLTFLVHKDHLHKVKEIQAVMEEEIELRGVKFRVKTDAECGLTWSKKMMPWTEDVTYDDVVQFEKENFEKKYPPAPPLDVVDIANMHMEI